MNRELYALIRDTQPNICQIVVLRNGEEICSGEWNGYAKEDCVHIASATKSMMSLLIGIAQDQGKIGSTEDKVLQYFPQYRVKRGENTIRDVTIEHLLTMRAPYKGKGDPWTKVCTSEHWTDASLDFLGGKKGITGEFDYRTVCLHILSGILYQATGMKTADFANRYLFAPLGIAEHRNFYAKNAEEHKRFTLEKTPKENVWFADPDGLCTAGYGLCMSAKDMAKIGQMCLQNGFCDGRQIISTDRILKIKEPKSVESGAFRGMAYGYLWWIVHPERGIYAAIGDGGNVLYIHPEENTVVAITSYFKAGVYDRVDFIENTLLPSLRG